MMGFAIDLGRLYMARSELKAAANATIVQEAGGGVASQRQGDA